MFKQFLTESPASVDFLSTIAKGGKLYYPESNIEFLVKNEEFPHGYNMVLERINKYLIELKNNSTLEQKEKYPSIDELELLKSRLPAIGPGANLIMLKRILKLPIPIWDIIGNKIFLIDVNGNTFSAYSQKDDYLLCDAYKKFMTVALRKEENDTESANRISTATII